MELVILDLISIWGSVPTSINKRHTNWISLKRGGHFGYLRRTKIQ